MIIRNLILAAAFVVTGLAGAARGAIMLTLDSDQDLANLMVGQTVEFDIFLSGLDTGAGESIEYLAAIVTFNPLLLGPPGNVSAVGGIVPDQDGMLTSLDYALGEVDGNYDVLFAPSMMPITDNGVFFSFTVTVQSPGAGVVSFDHFDSFGVDPFGDPIETVVGGNPAAFSSVAATAVPEPATGILILLGAAPWILATRRRKLQRSNTRGDQST